MAILLEEIYSLNGSTISSITFVVYITPPHGPRIFDLFIEDEIMVCISGTK